jgi:hypothetical protein
MTSLKGLFARVRFRKHRRAHAERKKNREQEPAGVTNTGAGIRHGQTPPGYVPPADEGRPRH